MRGDPRRGRGEEPRRRARRASGADTPASGGLGSGRWCKGRHPLASLAGAEGQWLKEGHWLKERVNGSKGNGSKGGIPWPPSVVRPCSRQAGGRPRPRPGARGARGEGLSDTRGL